MRASTSVSQTWGSMPLILQLMIRLYIAAALGPPRSEPQKSHDFLPRAAAQGDKRLLVLVGVQRLDQRPA